MTGVRAARVSLAWVLSVQLWRPVVLSASSLVVLAGPAPGAVESPLVESSLDPGIARRARAMLAGISAEYRESLGSDGRVERPRELAEARGLARDLRLLLAPGQAAAGAPLESAHDRAGGGTREEALGGAGGNTNGSASGSEIGHSGEPEGIASVPTLGHGEGPASPHTAVSTLEALRVTQDLAALIDALDRQAPVAEVETRVATLRARIGTSGGQDGSLPRARPDPRRGAEIYAEHCVPCHGEDGAGNGPSAAALPAPPAAFTDPSFMERETPADFALVIDLGRRVTGMPAWNEVLDTTARWDVVSWLWSLGIDPAELERGDRLFAAHCAACHGDELPAASALALDRLAGLTDAQLADRPFTEPSHPEIPGLGDGVAASDRRALTAALRHRSLGAIAARRAPPPTAEVLQARSLARVIGGVRASLEAYRQGGAEAPGLAGEAYLEFEPLEAGIAALDRSLVARTEAEFDRFRAALRSPASLGEVDASGATLLAVLGAIPGEVAAARRRREIVRWAVALVLAGGVGIGGRIWFRGRRRRRASDRPAAKKLRF